MPLRANSRLRFKIREGGDIISTIHQVKPMIKSKSRNKRKIKLKSWIIIKIKAQFIGKIPKPPATLIQ